MPLFPESAIRDEPALRGCRVPWAQANAGPIVRAFLDVLPEEWLVDPSTVVRAMPAWLRAGWGEGHVGWHLDGVTTGEDGQEDWINGRPAAFQRIGCNMGSNAPTRVLVGDVTLPIYQPGQAVVSLWRERLQRALAAGAAKELTIQEGELFLLSSSSFHSISAASRDGWRMFFDVNRRYDAANFITPTEDLYREVETDFQPTNAMEEALMSAYHSMDPR